MSFAGDTKSRILSNGETRYICRNKVKTVARILLIHQMVLIVVIFDVLSIVFVVYCKQRRFPLNFLEFSRTIVFSYQVDDFL